MIAYARQFAHFQRNARLYLVSNALSGVTTGILLLLYNLYLASLGYNADFIGLVLFVGAIGGGLAIFPAGYCIDRFRGKPILIWSNLLIGCAGAGQILFRQPIPLLLSAFIAGIGVAFILVINAPFLTRNSAPDERPHLFSLNLVLSLVTIVLGKLIGGVLPVLFMHTPWLMAPLPAGFGGALAAQSTPRAYQLALLVAGTIAAPSFIPFFLMREDHRRGVGLPRPEVEGLPRPKAEGLSRSLITWAYRARVALRNPRAIIRSPLFLLTLVQALIGFGAGLFIPYFNLYFVQHLHLSPALFGLIDGAATATTALFTLVAPWLAARVGRVRSIALTELTSVPLMLTIGLVPIVPLIAPLYLLRQGFMDMSNGVLQVFSMEAVPQQRRGVANSSYQAGFQIANALSSPLGGLIITFLGYSPIFVVAAVSYLLAISTLWANFGKRHKQTE
ncbi:MAG: MFS transporter [Ktedonobacteraceae bacterium]